MPNVDKVSDVRVVMQQPVPRQIPTVVNVHVGERTVQKGQKTIEAPREGHT